MTKIKKPKTFVISLNYSMISYMCMWRVWTVLDGDSGSGAGAQMVLCATPRSSHSAGSRPRPDCAMVTSSVCDQRRTPAVYFTPLR